MERKAVVAGQFYPRDEAGLRAFIARELPNNVAEQQSIAVVMPHAGYVYSGSVAAQTIASVAMRPTAIVLGPNHTGQGQPFSIMSRGVWRTPLGGVPINKELADALLRESSLITQDVSAHVYEHAIEVEIPFLQYRRPDISLVPLVVEDFRLDHYQEVGEAIARAIQQHPQSVLLVASSDFNHYEPQEVTKRKDKLAIEAILALDPECLIRVVRKEHISMCGFAPVAVALCAARCLGATSGTLVKYQTSADVAGDYERVVGYAGIMIC